MRRYIVTGAPGAGKTTILAGLRERGYAVVGEAATDVIAAAHELGRVEPWRGDDFLDEIAETQRERQLRPAPPGTTVQVFDRSPICTLALARYSDREVPPVLAEEIGRVLAERIYQPRVFLVHLLGFIAPTAVRRITLPQSVRFERFHVEAYREHGFELIDVPPAPIEERVRLIDDEIRRSSMD